MQRHSANIAVKRNGRLLFFCHFPPTKAEIRVGNVEQKPGCSSHGSCISESGYFEGGAEAVIAALLHEVKQGGNNLRLMLLTMGLSLFLVHLTLAENNPVDKVTIVKLDSAKHRHVTTRTIKAIKANTSPNLDGVLDESFWQESDWQGEFVQIKPFTGQPAVAQTQVALAFDKENIYVAFRCLNPTGKSSNSKIVRRDSKMDLDNSVTVYLDPYKSRRDCYYFSTNSLGTQSDGRLSDDGLTNDINWDCKWSVSANEDSAGWTVEIAIPVSELRFPKEDDCRWMVNFQRNCPDLFESSFWSERNFADKVSQSGYLTGFSGFKKKFEISLYPYMVALDTNTPSVERKAIYSSGGTDVITGADLHFNIGSSAIGNLTYNPDFATIEADRAVVNLTRYETYFSEKRLFFLEGAELFRTYINVFHSRRIGNIDFGIKSNGRVEKFNYALISANERASGEKVSSHATAFRLKRDVLGSSNIGLTTVSREFGGGYNRVLSTDATFQLPANISIASQIVGSFPSDGKSTKAYFVSIRRNLVNHNYRIIYNEIDSRFRENVNQVGFIPVDDRRYLECHASYNWWIKKRGIENISFLAQIYSDWKKKGDLRLLRSTDGIFLTFSNMWSVGFAGNYHKEIFEKEFHNHTIRASVGYRKQQWNSHSIVLTKGRNFDSDLVMWDFNSKFKLFDHLSLSYVFRYVNLSPDADKRSTVQHLLTTEYNFTPDLYLRLFTQYNRRNERFYLYGLLGWRFSPPFGALYVAYTDDCFDELDELYQPVSRTDRHAFFIKLSVPLSL